MSTDTNQILLREIVSILGDVMVTKTPDGRQHIHTLAKTADFSRDGQTCNRYQLCPGTRVEVTVVAEAENESVISVVATY